MPRYLKTPLEKLETRIDNLLRDDEITRNGNTIKLRNRILFRFNDEEIQYGLLRYYPRQKVDIDSDAQKVTFALSHESLKLFSGSIANPPRNVGLVCDQFRNASGLSVDQIYIGSSSNSYSSNTLYITCELFKNITEINAEEKRYKAQSLKSRVWPLFSQAYEIDISEVELAPKNYRLLLTEILASGDLTQQDVMSVVAELEEGPENQIVIKQQIEKQVAWLIETIQEIIDLPQLNTQIAREEGLRRFGYTKSSISGPEHLMEKILSDYGKNTLFGVPVLINTNKYVVNTGGLPRSQFDLILVDHLYDVQVVELKTPHSTVLDYDKSRNKFYASKDLSIAISQAERYISAVQRDNDDEYTISGQKIRDFLNDQVGDSMEVEVCRPKALIIIGTIQSIAKDYDLLPVTTKNKVTKEEYDQNCMSAYKELREAFKNIHILTYSELLEIARTRLNQQDQ